MFNFFNKKRKGAEVVDICFVSETYKFDALIALAKQEPSIKFLCWFKNTKKKLEASFIEAGLKEAMVIQSETYHLKSEDRIIMVEHHPSKLVEDLLFSQISTKKIEVYNALSEPLFKEAGAEKIIDLLKKMGMKDDEPIQHALISASIKRIQKKYESPLDNFIKASSQEEWMKINLKTI